MDEFAVGFPRSSPSQFIFLAHADAFTSHMLITTHTHTHSATLTLTHQRTRHQLFPPSKTMLIATDVEHISANKAELTAKTEHPAVSVGCQEARNICWTHCTSVPPETSERALRTKVLLGWIFRDRTKWLNRTNLSLWTSFMVEIFFPLFFH